MKKWYKYFPTIFIQGHTTFTFYNHESFQHNINMQTPRGNSYFLYLYWDIYLFFSFSTPFNPFFPPSFYPSLPLKLPGDVLVLGVSQYLRRGLVRCRDAGIKFAHSSAGSAFTLSPAPPGPFRINAPSTRPFCRERTRWRYISGPLP